MNALKNILLATALAFASSAFSVQYYVCSTGGSDGNAGTSSSAPWSTLTNVNDGTNYAKNSAIFSFCGGGSWTGKIQPPNDGLTYNVYNALPNFVGIATLSGNTLTVVSGGGGPIGIGSKVTMTGLPTCSGGAQCPVYVSALGTGTGGTGTYTVNVPSDVAVAVSTAVTITGAPPKIQGSGSDYALNINARNNTTVNGLAFLNAAYNVGFVQTSFQGISSGSIKNSVFGVTAASGSAKPLQFITSGGFNLRGVTFRDNFVFGPSYATTSTGQGIYFYHGPEKFYDFLIKGNAFYNIGGIGIQIVGSSMTMVTTNTSSPYGFDFDANYFVNIAGAGFVSTNSGLFSSPNQSYVRNNTASNIGTSGTPNVNALQLQWAKNVIVTGNTVTNVYTSAPDGDILEIDWAWLDSSHKSDGVIVSYNRLSGANAGGVTSCVQVVRATNTQVFGNVCSNSSVGFSNTHVGSSGTVFYNNTAYGLTAACGNLDDGATGDPSGQTTWYNNIFANCGSYTYRVANGSTAPTETNSVYFGNDLIIRNTQTNTSIPISAKSVVSDPKFKNAAAGDFHILRGSPAIGLGIWTDSTRQYQTDIDGFRTTNPKPDAGAYFYRPGAP